VVDGDFRIAFSFKRHWKRGLLERALGPAGVLALVDLWAFAAEMRPDGDLSGLPDEAIEAAAGWSGEPGALIAALERLRLLDGARDSRRLHDWAEHQPWIASAPTRKAKARLAAAARWGASRADSACYEHATSMLRASNEHANRNAPIHTDPIRSDPSTEIIQNSDSLQVAEGVQGEHAAVAAAGADAPGAPGKPRKPGKPKESKPSPWHVRLEPGTEGLEWRGITDADVDALARTCGVPRAAIEEAIREVRDHAEAVPAWYSRRRSGNWLATIRNWAKSNKGRSRGSQPTKLADNVPRDRYGRPYSSWIIARELGVIDEHGNYLDEEAPHG